MNHAEHRALVGDLIYNFCGAFGRLNILLMTFGAGKEAAAHQSIDTAVQARAKAATVYQLAMTRFVDEDDVKRLRQVLDAMLAAAWILDHDANKFSELREPALKELDDIFADAHSALKYFVQLSISG